MVAAILQWVLWLGLAGAQVGGPEAVRQQASYKGWFVSADIKERGESVRAHYADIKLLPRTIGNHLLSVRVTLTRDAGSPSELVMQDRAVVVPFKDVRLKGPGSKFYYSLSTGSRLGGDTARLDKELQKGTAYFYVEVPPDVHCEDLVLELDRVQVPLAGTTMPKGCR